MDGIGALQFFEKDIPAHDVEEDYRPAARERNSTLDVLSSRQREIVRLASEGLLNKQIAHELGITVATVKAHMSLAIERLSAKNRTHAVAIYVRSILTH